MIDVFKSSYSSGLPCPWLYPGFGSQSKQRQTKTAKVKTTTSLNGDKRHSHNGDKLKRRNPKRRQEMVGLCEALNFQAVISCIQYIIIAVQRNIKHLLKVASQPQQLITKWSCTASPSQTFSYSSSDYPLGIIPPRLSKSCRWVSNVQYVYSIYSIYCVPVWLTVDGNALSYHMGYRSSRYTGPFPVGPIRMHVAILTPATGEVKVRLHGSSGDLRDLSRRRAGGVWTSGPSIRGRTAGLRICSAWQLRRQTRRLAAGPARDTDTCIVYTHTYTRAHGSTPHGQRGAAGEAPLGPA